MSRIDSTPSFRVQGEVISLGKLAKEKPGFAIPATAEQVAELKSHDEQSQAREAAAVAPAEAVGGPDQAGPVGQPPDRTPARSTLLPHSKLRRLIGHFPRCLPHPARSFRFQSAQAATCHRA